MVIVNASNIISESESESEMDEEIEKAIQLEK